MKIEKTYIKDKELHIILDRAASITKVYLDGVDNSKNMYSTDDVDHQYVVTVFHTEDNIHYTIDLVNIEDNGLVVTVISTTKDLAFAINEEAIYFSKIGLFTSFCQTCLDNTQKEKILICELRSNLLKYAINNHLLNDAVQHYKDLSRVLNLSSCCGQCSSCTNGMCSL